MTRTEIINHLIQKVNGKSYLEIGVAHGSNFASIKCFHKVGVDPSPESPATVHLTSDEYFSSLSDELFDVIFIDGMHLADYVYRDITNALCHLNQGGYIICHDMNPIDESHQTTSFNPGIWNGTCWKALVLLRQTFSELNVVTVDTDNGCSILWRDDKNAVKLPNDLVLTYANLEANRKEWLNLISVEEFKEQFNVCTNTIPVIGAPVVNSTKWIKRLIDSVDYPVKEFCIINNNGRGEIDNELAEIAATPHPFIEKIKLCNLPANIGCAGAWNLIIKSYMTEPYWIISNDDVAFKPGLLKELAEAVKNNPDAGLIHPGVGDFGLGTWDLFLLKDFVVQEVGLFDENTYPAYCEDADYLMRVVNAKIPVVKGTKAGYWHGDGDSAEYYETGSQTKKSDPQLVELLSRANELNIEYLTDKWSVGWRSVDPAELPFGKFPLSYTTYDLEFVRSKYTGF